MTDAQKAAIAEARNFYDAKMAEQEVLHQSKMRADLRSRETLAAEYRRDRERLTSERDTRSRRSAAADRSDRATTKTAKSQSLALAHMAADVHRA